MCGNMAKADLHIDWATHKAAEYACKTWHYSGCVPAGKLVKVGAWESGTFIGVVIFSRGANNNMLQPYGLQPTEGCELARVALRGHITPVSRIIAIAMKFLKKANPKLRLVVSYADMDQGHNGGIYQAGNWIYAHTAKSEILKLNGVQKHRRSVNSRYGHSNVQRLREAGFRVDVSQGQGKHCYLYALDPQMRASIQPLAKPYPKRVKQATCGNPS